MAKKKPLIVMVSSTVYGIEELLERIYAILTRFGYEVWMSHKGTVPVISTKSAFDNCLHAVEQFFYDFSLIGTTVTGSGTRTNLTNGLSYSKALSPVWGVQARAADDSGVNQVVTQSMLETLGCDFRIVPNGEAALEALRRAGLPHRGRGAGPHRARSRPRPLPGQRFRRYQQRHHHDKGRRRRRRFHARQHLHQFLALRICGRVGDP